MVPSLCGPKAPSALSLSATLVAIVLCLSLRRFSTLFHCCCFRPMGISFNCSSPVTEQDKKQRRSHPKNPEEQIVAAPDTSAPWGCYTHCALQPLEALQKAWFAHSGEDASPSSSAKCSCTGFLHHQLWYPTGTSSYQQPLLPGSTKTWILLGTAGSWPIPQAPAGVSQVPWRTWAL